MVIVIVVKECISCVVLQSMLTKLLIGSAKSVTYSHDGEMIAVGMQNGEIIVLLVKGFKVWGKRRDRAGSINDIR